MTANTQNRKNNSTTSRGPLTFKIGKSHSLWDKFDQLVRRAEKLTFTVERLRGHLANEELSEGDATAINTVIDKFLAPQISGCLSFPGATIARWERTAMIEVQVFDKSSPLMDAYPEAKQRAKDAREAREKRDQTEDYSVGRRVRQG